MKRPLSDIKVYLLDMDGTFYIGSKILPTSYEFIKNAEAAGVEFVFLTNNSSKNRYDYVKKLAGMNYHCGPERILSSGEATTRYLKKRKPGARVYLVGTPSLEQEFVEEGFILTDTEPDFAVLGFDTTLTYEKLWKFCDHIRRGVPYIATHPDINCPIDTDTGFMPDIGSMMKLIETSTGGLQPEVIIGKPYGHIVDAAAEKFGVTREQVAMVGDRLATDIALGPRNGITSILVLTGEATLEDVERSDIKPDYIFSDLGALSRAFSCGGQSCPEPAEL